MNLGLTEILLILGIALLFFGPSRLPSLGKSMGEAIRSFKRGLEEPVAEDKPATNKGDTPPEVTVDDLKTTKTKEEA